MRDNKGVLSNFIWKFAERISAQLVTLIVSIVLARQLSPSEYGIISIVTIFITFANVFISDGLGTALIQKKDADSLDFSSVLFFNVGISVVLYLCLYFSAPYIAMFYGDGYEILTPVMRVLGVKLIIAAISSIQQAYVSREMIFHKFFVSTLVGTIFSGFVGIYLAYNGYGVWALVAQYLSNSLIGTFCLSVSLRWIPKIQFSFERIRKNAKFGLNILSAKLIVVGFEEIRALLIGKFYSSQDLAYYDKGKQFPNLVVANVDASLSAVLLPKMSRQQDDLNAVRATMRSSIRLGSFVMFPLFWGLMAIGDNLIVTLLTEKWLQSVELLRIFCVYYMFNHVHSANLQAIKAIGKSNIFLKLEYIKKAIEIIVLIVVVRLGVTTIALSMAVLSTMFLLLNTYPSKRIFNYGFIQQFKDVIPSLFASATMGCFVWLISFLPLGNVVMLFTQVIVGAVIYIVVAKILNIPELLYIWTLFKRVLSNKSR